MIILLFEFALLDLFFFFSASVSVSHGLKYSSFSSLKCVTVVYAPLPLTDVSQRHTFGRGRAPTFRCFSTFGLHIVHPHNSWSARFTTFIKNCLQQSLLVALKPPDAKFSHFCCFSGFALYCVKTCNKFVFAQEVEGQRVIAALGILLNLFGVFFFFFKQKISKLFDFVPNSIFSLVNYSCLSIWNQQMFSMSQQLVSNFASIN